MSTPVTGSTGTHPTSPSSLMGASSPGSLQNTFGMSPNQFLQLLVTQLTTQDPLSPVDDNSFMQQMVGLAELQSTSSLTGSLNAFQNFMELSSGSALIGKSVQGTDASGNPVEGTVSSVLLQNGTVNVVIGSQTIPLTAVTQING